MQLINSTGIKPGLNTYIIPVIIKNNLNPSLVSDARKVMYVSISIASISLSLTDLNNKNFIDIVVNQSGTVTTGTNTIYLRTFLDRAISTAVVNSVVIDNSIVVDSISKANNTNYLPFPANAYQLIKDNAKIPANAKVSADSIQLNLTDFDAFKTGDEYLLAVRLKDEGIAGTPIINSDKNMVLIHLYAFLNNVDSSNAGLTGTTMDRTGWTVTSGGNDYLPPSRMLDNDNSTAWIGVGLLPDPIVLNMGSPQTVKGFSIVPDYQNTRVDILATDVLSSNDGIIWKLQGNYKGTVTSSSSSADNPDSKTVKFISPVTAKYFKFNITKSSYGGYTGMSELNGVQ